MQHRLIPPPAAFSNLRPAPTVLLISRTVVVDGERLQAARSLMRNFSPAAAGYTQAGALMSFNVAIATYAGCRKTSGALSSTVFNNGVSGSGMGYV